jgi:hypothetical protein
MPNNTADRQKNTPAGGNRRIAGLGLCIAGVALLGVCALGLAFSWGSTKGRPATALVASTTATAPAASTATPDPVAVWQALLDPFSAAIASRDTSYLLNHIDPALYQVYTPDQCRTELAKPAPDPTIHFSVLSVSGPAPWSYAAGGQTIAVSAVYTVDANVTANGQTARETHHFALHNGELSWFTHCSATGQ